MQLTGTLLGLTTGTVVRFYLNDFEQERKQFYFNLKAVMDNTPPYGLFFFKQFLEVMIVEAIFFWFWGVLLNNFLDWPNSWVLYLIYWSLVQLRKSSEKSKLILEHLPIGIELFLTPKAAIELHQGWILGNIISWGVFSVWIHRKGWIEVPWVSVPKEQTLKGQLEKMIKQN